MRQTASLRRGRQKLDTSSSPVYLLSPTSWAHVTGRVLTQGCADLPWATRYLPLRGLKCLNPISPIALDSRAMGAGAG